MKQQHSQKQTSNESIRGNTNAPPNTADSASTKRSMVDDDVLGGGLEAFADYLLLGELAIGWAKDVGDVARLELERSLIAFKNILGLKLFLLPMMLLLYISVCGSAAYVAFIELQSIYAGLGVLLLSQVMGVMLMRRSITYNRNLIGFENTKRHALKVKNDIVNTLK